ncbi:chalcone isomerase family protein [Paraburkholderia sp. SUR17]|uniref:chalcone isomerase family protein n=1 Tax=Paraburkholderia sp. SUR17 TaxID=3034358 RepID=UPI0024081D31|nr:chalcone isomerase family protein [Paraburkholderia sp. SUR17]WEY37702.1 chalcone isomerase family protein [Paraburkholderia sp. SUR17]
MRTKLALAGLALALACITASARAECRSDVPQAHLIGRGPFCFLGFCLYDAQLWAQRPPYEFDEPFALLLTYRRAIKADTLVDAGIGEIRRLAQAPLPAGTLDAWRADMRRAFNDVAPGDRLCGVFMPGHGARFYTNGTLTAQIDDTAFAVAFFRIWLDPETRAARLRQSLLGARQ